MKYQKAFTLVEILIVVVILGILASVVIPQFTNASTDAKTSCLCANLRRIRLQIELYKREHNENPPRLSDFAAQMTGTTDINGDSNGTDYGPYLMSIPVEHFTNSNAVTANGTNGWNYNESTGEFRAPHDLNL